LVRCHGIDSHVAGGVLDLEHGSHDVVSAIHDDDITILEHHTKAIPRHARPLDRNGDGPVLRLSRLGRNLDTRRL
jgi:hypothetical protein